MIPTARGKRILSNSLHLSLREWPRLPFTARIERAPFHRARSASKKGTWPLPPLLADFFSILLALVDGHVRPTMLTRIDLVRTEQFVLAKLFKPMGQPPRHPRHRE